MLYNKDKQWAFVHVPKNAGTSIEFPFHEYSNPDFKNAKREKGVSILPGGEAHHNKWSFWSKFDEVKNLIPIALLRNPWDRCLSLYTFNLKESAKNLKEDWAKTDHGRLIKEGFKQSWMPGGFFVDGHGNEVEYNLQTRRAWAQDEDQYSWLDGKGKWFRMEDQMEQFCLYTGLAYPDRVNTTARGDYRNYYDDELAERIGDLFARDVALGGYKF